MRKHQLFLYLEAEDSVIEWLQVLFLVVNAGFSAVLSKHFSQQKHKLLAYTFAFLSFGFFVVLGEEISWGQRIFNFQTPAEYAAINNQNELTLHNYEHIYGYVYKTYMVIGLLGSSLWIFKNLFEKLSPSKINGFFKTLIPDWQYFFFFFILFAYNLEAKILHPKPGDALWEEPTELLLFIALAIFQLELLRRRKNNEK